MSNAAAPALSSSEILANLKCGRWNLDARPVVAIVDVERRYENADGDTCYDRTVEAWPVLADGDGRPTLAGGTLVCLFDPSRRLHTRCAVFGSGNIAGLRGIEAHVRRYEERAQP